MTINFVDVTLRDGNHTYRHQFDESIISKTAHALDLANIDIIEVGHGDGLGGSCLHVGQAPISDRIAYKTAVDAAPNTRVAALVVPGFATFDDLEMLVDVGVQIARVACHCTEANTTKQHIRKSKDLGLFTAGHLICVGMASASQLAEEAVKLESYGVDYINLAESTGHWVPDDVRRAYEAIGNKTSIPLGFHAHNNLGLGIGNMFAAIETGATYIDGSLRGYGAGSGNAQTEVAVAALLRGGYTINANLLQTLEAASIFERSLDVFNKPDLDNDTTIMGYANLYGGYLYPVRRVAKEYNISTLDLISALGSLGVVAGQEDMVVEVAQKLRDKTPSDNSEANAR